MSSGARTVPSVLSMATTLNPARPFPGAGEVPARTRVTIDEAFAATGVPRPPYADVLDALARQDLVELRERVRSNAAALGLSFGPGRPMVVDPVPRLIDGRRVEAARGRPAAAGPGAQRLPRRRLRRPADLRRRRRAAAPARDLARVRAAHARPARSRGPGGDRRRPRPDPRRERRDAGPRGQSADALRLPAYALAVREAVAPELGAVGPAPRASTTTSRLLGAAIRAAAPDGRADPAAAIVSDGPESGAWYEHRRLGRELDIPVVTPRQLEVTKGRLYCRQVARARARRRRLPPPRRGPPERARRQPDRRSASCCCRRCESGRLRCVNAFGTGVADDKLAHAYAESMVRFYLGEEPLLRSVPSFDLSDEMARKEALERLDELVRQAARRLRRPRRDDHAAGDRAAQRRRAIGLLRRRPEGFVAQETVQLSSHPTVCGARLRPRRVDLRPFVVSAPAGIGGDARRADPLRPRRRRDGRQQLARRRLQGHLGGRGRPEAGDEAPLARLAPRAPADRRHHLRGAPGRARRPDPRGRAAGPARWRSACPTCAGSRRPAGCRW